MASSFGSAGTPPPGVESNFDNPASLYPEILATVIICITLTTLFTIARLIAKRAVSAWTLEDYVLLIAWAANIAYDVIFLVQGQAGLGRHIWDVQAADSEYISQLSWALEILYSPAIWIAKAALLLQLMRIFAPTKSGAVYWAIQGLIWGNLAFYTSTTFVIIFECTPPEKVWNPLYSGGYCINVDAAIIATSAFNVVSDLLVLILPIWAALHLRLALKQKIGVVAVFATGLIAVSSSICRLVYTLRIPGDKDSTYIIAQVAMWTLAEITSIILCTCFPMMPRFRRLVQSWFHGSKGGNSYYKSHHSKIPFTPRKPMSSGEDTIQNSDAAYGASPWVTGDDEISGLKNVNIPLEEQGEKDLERCEGSEDDEQDGIKKTISIDLKSQHRNGLSREAVSLV